jgi:hypothetical protein
MNIERMRGHIHSYIIHSFKEDLSHWINSLNERQIVNLNDHLYNIKSIEELKKFMR